MLSTRPWAKNLLASILFLIFLFFMFRWFEHRQIYFPTRKLATSGAELGRPMQDVRFTTADGLQLHGWFFPAPTNSLRADFTFLICHGNAGNISHRLDLCALLLDLGANVFVFDYRGYGLSQGRPSEEGTYLDALAAHHYVTQRGLPSSKIIALGESLGGAIAAELALRAPLGGLILQSTFTSIPAIGAELFPFLPVKWICSIHYNTIDKLPRLKIPLLILHSRADSLIGFHHAQANFAAAQKPKFLHELSGDHNDALLDSSDEFAKAIDAFLGHVILAPGVK